MIENQPVKIVLETLGCKLNLAETEHISRKLSAAGYRIVSPQENADVYILNTCTITHVADRKSRHFLRMARRRNPELYIISLGCYSDYDAKTLEQMGEVDLALGNESKNNLVEILKKSGITCHPAESPGILFTGERTRSFIKAQDGCNNFCTYCIVPYVRGREKSLPLNDVVNEIQSRVENGFKEVVLTGTEVGRYSFDRYTLVDLLSAILKDTAITRLRLSSLQPQEINEELLELWDNSRLCRHFHISLQSGADSVLDRMNRRYRTADFSAAVRLLRDKIPDVSITTDVIVGFPGETEEEFQQSYEFCRDTAFSRIHVFSYSQREGTRAAVMREQVDARIKKQRSMKMIALGQNSLKLFNKRFLNRELDVLFEQCEGSMWSGLTDNYIKVYVNKNRDLSNQILPVKITGISGDGVIGELKD